MKPGAFREFRELMIQRGASPSQVKIPRVVVADGPLAQFLLERRV
jgi:auxin responsive GH3 gene family